MNQNSVVQPEGNYYDKYHSSNPIVKWMMKHFFGDLQSLLEETGNVKRILEAGCGEGNVTGYISREYCDAQINAFDISQKVIEEAQEQYHNISFSVGNIYEIDSEEAGYDLVVCSEVLEHLEHPQEALLELERVTSKYLIVSVPREPIWRVLNMARGKYLKDLGNTPGHIQHWSKSSFVNFLRTSGMTVKTVKTPLPWTMVLLEKEG